MNNMLLHNAGILTMNESRDLYPHGAIQIEGNRIARLGRSESLFAEVEGEVECVDLKGRWILPGLINTHVHTSQQLARGLADDVDLLTWLHDRIWPYESTMTEEDSYVSSLLCGLEMIRSGVTTFAEPGGQHVNGMGRAVTDLGLRAQLARSTMDMGEGLPVAWIETTQSALDRQIEIYEKWHAAADDRIRVWFGLRTIFNNSDELIQRTKQLADHYGVGVHMHVAEIPEENEFAQKTRGGTTVKHLDNLGVLDRNFLAVHCVWMTDEEIQIFADREVNVSHCPAAAMRVLGFPRIPEMIDACVCVSLGTDGAPTNNRMSLIDEMWLASLIHKGRTLDPTAVPAERILEMVTVNGAQALLWDQEIGSLEVGKKADLIVINPNTPTMLPIHDVVANLVTSMRVHNVESVMVDGRWLMRDGEILVIDEREVVEESRRRAADIVSRAGINLPDRFNVVG